MEGGEAGEGGRKMCGSQTFFVDLFQTRNSQKSKVTSSKKFPKRHK